MNADRLLELYEEISDASDAIAQLRDVVLEVGVRGKLNEQDDAETVSSEFLNETNTPELPANWRTLNFGKYCNIEGGNQPPKSQFIDSPRDGYVRLFQIRDLGERPVPVYIPETSTKRFSVEGEILIGRYGASVGKVFWAQNGAYNVALAKFIFPARAFLPDFAFRLLKSSFFQKALEGASRTAQAGFNKGDLAHIDFPLPPIAEQHRIVAKVDELMALCDQLEQARTAREAVRDRLTTASLARLTAPGTDAETFQSHARFALQSLPALTTRPDQIKTLRQTILNLAVRGNLVEQNAADEPAAELLKRIDKEIASKRKEMGLRPNVVLQSVDEDDAPFDLPYGWAWARFPEVGVFARGKSKHRPRNDPALYVDGTVPFVQTGDVARSGGVVRTHSAVYNDTGLRQSMLWPAGTMCITIAANIADSGILTFDACFPDSVVGLVVASHFENARFFEYFVRTAKANLTEFAPATAQKNINLGILEMVLIPLPPLAEQHRIVAKVDTLMALCDQLEASLASITTTRSKLLEALLHEALDPAAVELEAAE